MAETDAILYASFKNLVKMRHSLDFFGAVLHNFEICCHQREWLSWNAETEAA